MKIIPASFFGIVLGMVGLGDCWRLAAKVWGLPSQIGEAIMFIAFGVWVFLIIQYLFKWMRSREEALAEFNHPVQSCFIGLSGVATLLAAVAIGPHWHALAQLLFVIGALMQLIYGVYFMGRSWMGERDISSTTAAIYLPSVAGNFVSAFVSGYMGYQDVGILFFGAGLFSWLMIESLITHRLYHSTALPETLRPTIGIMLAPPVVGCIGYLFITSGRPDIVAQALFGYGLLQLLLLARVLGWVTKQPFTASYWAFSFGITAIAFDAIVFVQRGLTGYIEWLSIILFVFANAVLLLLIVKTVLKFFNGTLLPPPLLAKT
ncbi:MAG: dicarboxylate transporter/tellurite-resistance protein TehA [Polynucleobacter sp.]|jgi:tellurite resistance protein|nr:dicarboxylate transporter/tellurite-resistance protein TehA [Polynucleobacter sp.]